MVPPDQVIEQTIIKNQKRTSGIAGFSTNVEYIQRWVLSSHIIAIWNSEHYMDHLTGIDKQETQPKDVLKSKKGFGVAAFQSCIDTINEQFFLTS